jgi:hypothetical protein
LQQNKTLFLDVILMLSGAKNTKIMRNIQSFLGKNGRKCKKDTKKFGGL